MATDRMSLYEFMGGLETAFSGKVTPSEENSNKYYLDFYLCDDIENKYLNPEDERIIELSVLEHDDGFSIAVDDHTLGIVSDDFSVKTVEEAIKRIRMELGI